MKWFRSLIQRFLFTVLLVQMLNISFNCVNLYNTGSSGFRHKVSFNFFEIDVLTHLNLDDQNNNQDSPEKLFLENFELGLFFPLIKINSIPESGTHITVDGNPGEYQDHVAELSSPPPKVA